MDAEPRRHNRPSRLRRVEGQVRRQDPALLLSAQRLPPHHQRTAWRDAPSSHLPRVPKQLPMAARPHRRGIQLLKHKILQMNDSYMDYCTTSSSSLS